MSEGRGAVQYTVTIGGATLKQTENDTLQMLTTEDHVDMVGVATIRVAYSETGPRWNFQMGDPVKVQIERGDLFSGEVTGIQPGYQMEGISTVTIQAMDKSHRLGRGTKTRFWNDMKDSAVAQEVGAECGLSVDADDTGEVLPYILQRNESNMTFLKRLAARNNFQCRVEGESLLFKKASFQGSAASISMGENLRSMRMSFNSSEQVQQVIVRGWSATDKAEVVGTASAGDVTSIGGGQVGASASSVFGDSVAYITDVPVSSQEQANAIARAEMERYARQFCRGSLTIIGDSSIKAGSMIELGGLPQGQNGNFYVIATRHILSSRSGYTTEVTFCSNTMGS